MGELTVILMDLDPRLVDETAAVLVHEQESFTQKSDPEGGFKLGSLEADQTGQTGHVPQISADLLHHADPVPRIPGSPQEINRLHRQIIPLHPRIVFIPAAGEDDRAPGLDGNRLPLLLGHDSDDFPPAVGDQFLRWRAGQDLDPPLADQPGEKFPETLGRLALFRRPLDVVLHHVLGPAYMGESGPGDHGGVGHLQGVEDLDVRSHGPDPFAVLQGLSHKDFNNLPLRGLEAEGVEVFDEFLRFGNDDIAPADAGVPPSVGHLFQDGHLSALVMGGDCGGGSGGSPADYDDVVLQIPLFGYVGFHLSSLFLTAKVA